MNNQSMLSNSLRFSTVVAMLGVLSFNPLPVYASKYIYVEEEFVTLHQKRPSECTNTSCDGIYLQINGLDTSLKKYGLDFGFGDPGENPNYDGFDWPEFKLAAASYVKPANYDENGTYISETLGGGQDEGKYRKWHIQPVPDDFVIPFDLTINLFGASKDFFQLQASDSGYQFKWSSFFLNVNSAIPPSVGSAIGQAVTGLIKNGFSNLFGSQYVSAFENSQAVFDAISSIQNSSLDLFKFGLENFDTLSPAVYDQMVNDNFFKAQVELKNALKNLIGPLFPEAPAFVASLPGFSVEAGFDWVGFVADHLVQSLGYSATDISIISDGQGNSDKQAMIQLTDKSIAYSDTIDFAVIQNTTIVELKGGNDVAVMGPANNFVEAGSGNDIVIDNGGTDTAIYSADSSQYKVSLLVPGDQNAGYLIEGPDGADKLVQVERLQFRNGVFTANDLLPVNVSPPVTTSPIATTTSRQDVTFESSKGLFSDSQVAKAIVGSAAVDYLIGKKREDVIAGGSENDFLFGVGGKDFLFGEDGEDVIYGGTGGDYLAGGSGSDELYGGAGNDYLIGGTGNDLLNGGVGKDTYYYNSSALGSDDVAAGEIDTIAVTKRDKILFSPDLWLQLKRSGKSLSEFNYQFIGGAITADTNIASDGRSIYFDVNGDGVYDVTTDFKIAIRGKKRYFFIVSDEHYLEAL